MPDEIKKTVLLAVDAGLRTGFAEFDGAGRLLRYRSRHYPNRRVLKQRAYVVLGSFPELEWLVVEGGGDLLRPWATAAEKRGVRLVVTTADVWRADLLYKREQRSGRDAKRHAHALARGVVEWSRCKRPTSLRHDAAEAILAGVWGCVHVGLLKRLPEELCGPGRAQR